MANDETQAPAGERNQRKARVGTVKSDKADKTVTVVVERRVAHAVCYVPESKGYLDYNNRNVFFTVTKC